MCQIAILSQEMSGPYKKEIPGLIQIRGVFQDQTTSQVLLGTLTSNPPCA